MLDMPDLTDQRSVIHLQMPCRHFYLQPQLDAIKLFNQLAAADDLRMDAVLEPGGAIVSTRPSKLVERVSWTWLRHMHINSSLLSKRCCCAADIQLLNNHTILHARTAFVDWEVNTYCFLRRYAPFEPVLATLATPVMLLMSGVWQGTSADLLCIAMQEPERKRHLLRLWLSPDDDRPLPDYCELAVHLLSPRLVNVFQVRFLNLQQVRVRSYSCPARMHLWTMHSDCIADAELLGGSVEIGNRGGINVRGEQLKITLDAE
jgi:hypothetical protein